MSAMTFSWKHIICNLAFYAQPRWIDMHELPPNLLHDAQVLHIYLCSPSFSSFVLLNFALSLSRDMYELPPNLLHESEILNLYLCSPCLFCFVLLSLSRDMYELPPNLLPDSEVLNMYLCSPSLLFVVFCSLSLAACMNSLPTSFMMLRY